MVQNIVRMLVYKILQINLFCDNVKIPTKKDKKK